MTTTQMPRTRRGHSDLQPEPVRRIDWRAILLVCAMLSAPLYIAMDLTSALLYDGYNYKDQTISELSAIGAPTRPFWIPLGFAYSGLLIAGAIGIWKSAGHSRGLMIIAVLVGIVGILGYVGWPFAPMHQREVLAAGGGTTSDTMHLILGGINTVLFFLMLALGALAMGKNFRLYSIATILLMVIFGTLMGLETADVADNEPTPWLGIWERLAVESPMVWITVLAAVLLYRMRGSPAREPDLSGQTEVAGSTASETVAPAKHGGILRSR